MPRRGERVPGAESPPTSPGTRDAHSVRVGELRVEGSRLLVPVRVTPRAGRDALAFESGILRARLTAPPVDGAANDALVALLAKRLRVPKRSITITHGATARDKTLAIEGLGLADFHARLTDQRAHV